jgi:hypothetical protein
MVQWMEERIMRGSRGGDGMCRAGGDSIHCRERKATGSSGG